MHIQGCAMSNPADTLSQMIEALTEESNKGRRRTHANAAYTALRQMREALPPATAKEAEESGYQRGLLDSIRLAKEAREMHEKPVRDAESVVGQAYSVLSGICLYGQSITITFESLVQRALMASLKRSKEAP
jgi:hypothetical protein